MQRKVRARLILFYILLSSLFIFLWSSKLHAVSGGTIKTAVSLDRSQMMNQPVKLYEKIGEDSFLFDSDTLTYDVYFALTFASEGGIKKIVTYVYITALTYVTNAVVDLTYDMTIIYNEKTIHHTGFTSDTAPFLDFNPSEIHAFKMDEDVIYNSEFPTTMEVVLNFTLDSGDISFYLSDTKTMSKYFFSPDMELWVLIALIGGGAGGVAVIIIITYVVKKKKANTPISKMSPKMIGSESDNPNPVDSRPEES